MPKTPSRGYWHQAFLWRAANAGMLVRCASCGERERWSEQERVVLPDDAGDPIIQDRTAAALFVAGMFIALSATYLSV